MSNLKANAAPNLPTLLKHCTDGGVQEWNIRVEPQNDGTAVIVTTHGRQGGKKQEARDHIKEGKNLGKRSETSPLEQAYAEAEAKHTKQLERECYGHTVEESKVARDASPMLAQKFGDYRNKVQWDSAFEQPKLDGYRCTIMRIDNEVILRSRKGICYQLPHIGDPAKSVLQRGDMFDGELYGHGISLNKISSMITRPRGESEQLQYHVYDMKVAVRPDLYFEARYGLAEDAIGNGLAGVIKTVETTQVTGENDLMELQARRIDDGYEGSILRHGRTPYQAGQRSTSLLKVKTFTDDNFKVVAVNEGKGTFAGMAVFTCITPAGNFFDVTAPGTHVEKKQYFMNGANFIGQNLTVKFAGYTKTDKPVPWHPVATGFKEL